MELDVVCLRWAKLEALERLARALRVPLPEGHLTREARHRKLVWRIATALEEGAQQPVMETSQ